METLAQHQISGHTAKLRSTPSPGPRCPPCGSPPLSPSSGEGYSDAFRPLRGRALTWFDGKRLIGHGGQVATQGLRAGRHRIRLAVRDHRGRRSSATVIVRILPARVRFRLLRVPRSVSRRGRLLRLRIAATGPAVLRVGGRRFAVDRRVRTVTLRIRPGRRTLSLAPTLVSGPYRTSVALAVARG